MNSNWSCEVKLSDTRTCWVLARPLCNRHAPSVLHARSEYRIADLPNPCMTYLYSHCLSCWRCSFKSLSKWYNLASSLFSKWNVTFVGYFVPTDHHTLCNPNECVVRWLDNVLAKETSLPQLQCSSVLPFSKSNKLYFWYLGPVNIFLDTENN